MSEVVLGPLSGLQGDGGPDGHGRYGQCGEDHPLGPAGLGIDSQGHEILVGDALEPLTDGLRRELLVTLGGLLAEGGGLVQLDLVVLGTTVGTYGPVGCALGGLLGECLRVDGVPSELVHTLHLLPCGLRLLCGEHEPSAIPVAAAGVQKGLDVLDESNVDDGPCEFDVSEVSGTLTGFASAGLTLESGLDDTEAGVHESALVGETFVVVRVRGDDLHGGHLPDLFRGKARELDRTDPLDHIVAHLKSSSLSLMATPSDRSSSMSSLNA